MAAQTGKSFFVSHRAHAVPKYQQLGTVQTQLSVPFNSLGTSLTAGLKLSGKNTRLNIQLRCNVCVFCVNVYVACVSERECVCKCMCVRAYVYTCVRVSACGYVGVWFCIGMFICMHVRVLSCGCVRVCTYGGAHELHPPGQERVRR